MLTESSQSWTYSGITRLLHPSSPPPQVQMSARGDPVSEPFSTLAQWHLKTGKAKAVRHWRVNEQKWTRKNRQQKWVLKSNLRQVQQEKWRWANVQAEAEAWPMNYWLLSYFFFQWANRKSLALVPVKLIFNALLCVKLSSHDKKRERNKMLWFSC